MATQSAEAPSFQSISERLIGDAATCFTERAQSVLARNQACSPFALEEGQVTQLAQLAYRRFATEFPRPDVAILESEMSALKDRLVGAMFRYLQEEKQTHGHIAIATV